MEADLSDAWARGQLEKLQYAVGEDLRGGLMLPDECYRNAVLGFHYLAQKDWASLCRAREHWGEALKLSGAKIPTGRILRYLGWIERQETRLARTCAPQDIVSSGPMTPEDLNKELDELLK